MGIYTAPERIERDGVLVAFKGEIMTEEEAVLRGILPSDKPESKEAEIKEEAEQDVEDAGAFAKLSNAELKDYITQKGGKFKAKATHAELVAIAEGLE